MNLWKYKNNVIIIENDPIIVEITYRAVSRKLVKQIFLVPTRANIGGLMVNFCGPPIPAGLLASMIR